MITNHSEGECSLQQNVGSNNTRVGHWAVSNNMPGSSNTAIGTNSQLYNKTGNNNTSIGTSSSLQNRNGSQNTSVGTNSQFYNTIGNSNTSLGAASLCNNTTGSRNTAIGSNALQGSQNILGLLGNDNVAVGVQSLYNNDATDLNTALGNYAGLNNQGSFNTFLGAHSDVNINSIQSTAIGANSIITKSNQIMLGTKSETVEIPGFANILGGPPVGGYIDSSIVPYSEILSMLESSKEKSPRPKTSNIANNRSHVPVFVGDDHIGLNGGTTGRIRDNIAIGLNAGQTNQGISSIAIGKNAGEFEQGSKTIAIGQSAGRYRQRKESIAIGFHAGYVDQPANTIILNASCDSLSGIVGQTSSFYVNPVRNDNTILPPLSYNTRTKEITYGSSCNKYNKNIVDLQEDTSVIYNVRPREFDTGANSTHVIGYIAEEINEASSYFTWKETDESPGGIAWNNLLLYAIEELKKQKETIIELKNIVSILKNK